MCEQFNDFLISINGGTWDTLDNAPTVSPAGGESVDVTFSIAETTAAGLAQCASIAF